MFFDFFTSFYPSPRVPQSRWPVETNPASDAEAPLGFHHPQLSFFEMNYYRLVLVKSQITIL